MRLCLAAALSLAMQMACAHAFTQASAPSGTSDSDAKPYVLHVYTNLVQVPALVLDTNYESLRPIAARDINIRLDAGPAFHPTQMHIEGEEPIVLAVVLDASGDQQSLLGSFAEAAETMSKAALRPHDRLTLYAVDCKIIRSSLNYPVEPAAVHSAVSRALSASGLHGDKTRGHCGRSLRLWDTAGIAAKTLAQVPGRRMLLVVTDGNDRKSILSWNSLREFASEKSIAIFGLRDLDHFNSGSSTPFRAHDAGVYEGNGQVEDHYRELCATTGGVILTTPPSQLTASLERLIGMVRGRYILEFPRTDHAVAGRHVIDVTLPEKLAYVFTSGVTVPMPDAALEKDPTTIPSAPSPAIMGSRHTLPDTH